MKPAGLVINSLDDLQIALMEDDNGAIREYIERLDRESANQAFKAAGEFFSFPTYEIEGSVRTSGGHLARVFGYKSPYKLTELLERRGILGTKLSGYSHHGSIQIKQGLTLDPDDNRSILYEYPAFLIGGMNSTNREARAVQLYLLRCERLARMGVVATRRPVAQAFPDPSHGMVMAKLCRDAWKGNILASYVLETHYHVPVKDLLHRSDPELSDRAGLITQYLHFVHEDMITGYGLTIEDTPAGFYIEGETRALYQAFLDTARKHNLKGFFGNPRTLGNAMAYEQDALEYLGFRRTLTKTITGGRIRRYEYTRPSPIPLHPIN